VGAVVGGMYDVLARPDGPVAVTIVEVDVVVRGLSAFALGTRSSIEVAG